MRLLAFSDIHNNLVAVRKLRAFEKNSFDAIVVAGDIGNETAAEFFKILATFECPVMYVYGNWDDELGYRASFGPSCQLLHSDVITIDNVSFTGFSGCPTDWGKNPIAKKIYRRIETENRAVLESVRNQARSSARKLQRSPAYQRYVSQVLAARSEILRANRESIGKAVRRAGVDPRNCVVVTHERLCRLHDALPGAPLHLFGHLHNFSERDFGGTKYVDVAALDRPVTARPRNRQTWEKPDCRNFNAGNYAIIEINSSQPIKVDCIVLPHDYPDWIPLEDRRYSGIAWIPEEFKWTEASDWPIARRTTKLVRPDLAP